MWITERSISPDYVEIKPFPHPGPVHLVSRPCVVDDAQMAGHPQPTVQKEASFLYRQLLECHFPVWRCFTSNQVMCMCSIKKYFTA